MLAAGFSRAAYIYPECCLYRIPADFIPAISLASSQALARSNGCPCSCMHPAPYSDTLNQLQNLVPPDLRWPRHIQLRYMHVVVGRDQGCVIAGRKMWVHSAPSLPGPEAPLAQFLSPGGPATIYSGADFSCLMR